MDNGWIKLHRKITDWEWSDDVNTFSLFVHLLILANFEDGKWHGIVVKRGQLISSYEKLAKICGISTQSVRTSINRLKSTGELTHQPHPNYGLFILNNYDEYQEANSLTNSQPTVSQQSTNNNIRRIRKKEEEEVKKGESENTPTPAQTMKDFLQMISEKGERYSNFTKQTSLSAHLTEDIVRAELDRFANYWTELTRDGSRQRWELEKVFEVSKRLGTWFSKINNFSTNKNHQRAVFIS